MNEYSKMTDNQVVSSIARKWSGSALDATKAVKDAEQPRPHDTSEYDLDHNDGLRFWEGFVIGLAAGIAIYAVLIRVFV
jgi:hypothetical protein